MIMIALLFRNKKRPYRSITTLVWSVFLLPPEECQFKSVHFLKPLFQLPFGGRAVLIVEGIRPPLRGRSNPFSHKGHLSVLFRLI